MSQILQVKKPTLLLNQMRNSFDLLGRGDQQPDSNSAREDAAWEYAVASELMRMAKVRKDKAQRAAVEAGALPDTSVETRPPGTHEIVYDGEWVQLMLKVNQPTVATDVTAFEQALRDRKVKQSVIDASKEAAQKVNKAPHQLSAVFRSSRGGAIASK